MNSIGLFFPSRRGLCCQDDDRLKAKLPSHHYNPMLRGGPFPLLISSSPEARKCWQETLTKEELCLLGSRRPGAARGADRARAKKPPRPSWRFRPRVHGPEPSRSLPRGLLGALLCGLHGGLFLAAGLAQPPPSPPSRHSPGRQQERLGRQEAQNPFHHLGEVAQHILGIRLHRKARPRLSPSNHGKAKGENDVPRPGRAP